MPPLYLEIDLHEFDTLYSGGVYKTPPENLWTYDGWKGPWVILRNVKDPHTTTVVLPKHVHPKHHAND